MNSLPIPFRALLLFVCGLATALVATPVSAAPAHALQVQINVPATWQPLFEDRVSEALVSHLSDVFRRQGFQGDITEVRAMDEPAAGCCLLSIDLIEWRMDPIGNIQCTFTANLQTDHATRHIPGVFEGMALRWMSGPGRFGVADSFGQAADDAIRQLYQALGKTELIPGLRNR